MGKRFGHFALTWLIAMIPCACGAASGAALGDGAEVSANPTYRSGASEVRLVFFAYFRFHKNELLVRVDDAKKESKFTINEMLVRSEWDRLQRHIDQQLKADEVREAQR